MDRSPLIRSMLLAACGKVNGSHRDPSLTRNLCYRCRNTGSLRGDMKTDPIGSGRLAALRVVALLLGGALAQPPGYPARTIRLVAGTAPGGITDYLARMSAEGLAIQLGAQVVVENKAGATGNLAIEHVAKSAPDGYTLLLVAGGNVLITPFLYPSLPFDPLNDILPAFHLAAPPH